MRNPLLIKAATIYSEKEVIDRGDLLIKNGIITAVSKVPLQLEESVKIIDGTGLTILPGFIDGHIHGANGADTMDATETALSTIAAALPKEGTTSFLATTITQSHDEIGRALANIATYKGTNGKAALLGAHLEGPFIHQAKKGAQPARYIVPGNIELFKHWQQIAKGNIQTVTLAPECDDHGLISFLYERGINVSAGHTTANYEEMIVAIQQGVRQITHLANAMTGIHHRDVGAVGAAFLRKELMVEVIADEIHLAPEMLEISFNQIGSDRIMLITDAMRAKSLRDGTYDLGGQAVQVNNNRAILADGTLAGSIVTMIDNVRHMLKISGVTLSDIVKMTAENAAKQLHIFDRKGSIRVGKDADLVIIDNDIKIIYTICQGIIAYEE